MKKEEFIRIRVAGWQKKYISLQAEKAHKSLSQYVRDAAMDKDVTVIDGVDDLICELRRQGNNLNQLVVMARQGHVELVNMEPFMEVYVCYRIAAPRKGKTATRGLPVRCMKAAGRIKLFGWLRPMNEETDATDIPAQG